MLKREEENGKGRRRKKGIFMKEEAGLPPEKKEGTEREKKAQEERWEKKDRQKMKVVIEIGIISIISPLFSRRMFSFIRLPSLPG